MKTYKIKFKLFGREFELYFEMSADETDFSKQNIILEAICENIEDISYEILPEDEQIKPLPGVDEWADAVQSAIAPYIEEIPLPPAEIKERKGN